MTTASLALLVVLQLPGPASAAFPEQAPHELAALREGVTPAAWLATHPQDGFTLFERDSVRENHASWCARASRAETGSNGTHMVRYAYFYPPLPPPSLGLPTIAGATLVREQCVLGTVWIETGPFDSIAGSTLALEVREALTRAHGPVAPGPDVFFGPLPPDSQRRLMARRPNADAMRLGLHFFGAAAWRIPGRWQVGSRVVVSTFDRGLGSRRNPVRGRVLAFAYLPIAELGSFARELDREAAMERQTAALAADAARLSGLPAPQSERLVGLLVAAESAYTGRHPANPAVIDSGLVAALGDWMASARAIPPARRAAALLAADQIVGSRAMIYVRGQRQDSAEQALEQLGAVFVRDELGGGYNYRHTWLDEALRLDSAGRVGTLATLALLRSGFNETGVCGGGPEPFRRVITVGERLLAGPLESATAAEVQRLVGDAYADIVALAAGAGREYADSAEFVAEAPAARDSAIAHYRRSFAVGGDSPEAREAWLEAWRLIAGLPPTTTHFFCVYD